MSTKETFTLSSLSLTSEDWDRSESDIRPPNGPAASSATPRNLVAFPREGAEDTPGRTCEGRGGRSLTSSIADVLKQWINSGTSPYEGEDDFFSRSQDDSSLTSRQSSRLPSGSVSRPRGQSESVVIPRSPKPDASFS
ncbi:hypothetical protein EDD16DRAFT_1550439 [Pisolithus croceorrhizus]|nr:hypothetical protein EDD16DRAFT_1550439 [Pisolithus croceorrhizus]